MTWQGEKTELPEFGLLFPLRRELTSVYYLGLGPRETTADRTAGGKMGAWSYNVRQDFAQNSPVYPQDCGSRTGVYSAAVTGSIPGIGFASGSGMTFSALPYTPHELENARHLYELPRDDNKTVVRCAAFQRGRGRRQQLGRKAPCGCLLCGGEGHDLLVLHPKAEWIIEKDQSGGAYQRLHSGLSFSVGAVLQQPVRTEHLSTQCLLF